MKMTNQEYYEKLIDLAEKGQEQIKRGRRERICRLEIANLVEEQSAREWRVAVFRRTVMERIAQAIAFAGYIAAVVLAVFAITLCAECVVSGITASLWIGYAVGALAALLTGAVAHAAYDHIG